MAFEIIYQCGHNETLNNSDGSLRTDKQCLECALRKLEYPPDGSLDKMWSDIEQGTLVLRTRSDGTISLGTKFGLFEMISEEASKRGLAPHQMVALAVLQFLSQREKTTAELLNEAATSQNPGG